MLWTRWISRTAASRCSNGCRWYFRRPVQCVCSVPLAAAKPPSCVCLPGLRCRQAARSAASMSCVRRWSFRKTGCCHGFRYGRMWRWCITAATHASGLWTAWNGLGWPIRPKPIPHSSAAGCAAAPRSPARSLSMRISCCSMSRLPGWTKRCGAVLQQRSGGYMRIG